MTATRTAGSSSGVARTRRSLETAARVAANASKATGRPLSDRAKKLLDEQKQQH